jgi:hypothetical protein
MKNYVEISEEIRIIDTPIGTLARPEFILLKQGRTIWE